MREITVQKPSFEPGSSTPGCCNNPETAYNDYHSEWNVRTL